LRGPVSLSFFFSFSYYFYFSFFSVLSLHCMCSTEPLDKEKFTAIVLML
jgi:hypothetical protein